MDSCTMTGLQVPFDSCDLTMPTSESSTNNFKQQYSASTDFNRAQQTHLVYISGGAADLTISSNTFTENVLHAALIKIDSTGTTTLSGNYFESNGVLKGATVLELRQCGEAFLTNN